MKLSFHDLFFPKRSAFQDEERIAHEEHHRRYCWAYYATLVLGFWFLAAPSSFGYQLPAMFWSDVITGALLVGASYLALGPYRLWAQWGVVFLGIWALIAPMLFSTPQGAAFLNGVLGGTLIVAFGIIIPGQPGIRLFAQPGPTVPSGWSYNPSSWSQRVPVIFFAWIGFFVSRYMGAYQLGYIDQVWDPFFGDGTREVLTSDVSKAFPVSDAMLGAFSYLMDVLFGYAGGTDRWRTMPWVVIIFGLLIVPLGVVSVILVILQPIAVGHWCTLCLTSGFISLIMIPFALDEVVATVQLMKHERKVRGTSYWTSLWFGGTMEGEGNSKPEVPADVMTTSVRESLGDLILRPWTLALAMIIGIAVMAAPGLLQYTDRMADNHHFMGAIIAAFALIAMSEVARTLRFILILFGIWLIISPWIIGNGIEAARWMSVVAGILLIPLSFPKGRISDSRAGFDTWIK